MRQLSPHDHQLLQAESPQANANITLLGIYDQRTVPGGVLRFKTVLSRIESRLERSPIFRRKLQPVPFALDEPYWIDDEHFDLEYHVRHIALPKPGDWRQFCIQVARLHARPLDLDRPLWEIYVIEGLDSFRDLPPGSFALVTKTHQVALDCDHGSELTQLLHDSVADAGPDAPAAPWFPRRAPSAMKLLSRGLTRAAVAPLRLAVPMAEAMTRQMAALAPAAFAWAGDLMAAAVTGAGTPSTRFNSVVSSRRVFETRRFALEDFRAMRALAEGATVNDCVLAVCAGALRRYLEAHGELPEASLSAVVPVTVRRPGTAGSKRPSRDEAGGDGVADTSLSWAQVALATGQADALQRLRDIVAHTSASETLRHAVPAEELTDSARHTPAATMALAGRMLGLAQLSHGRSAPLGNCTITNVPGSAVPLYLCGARMTWTSAMLPLSDGMGLVIAVTSYDGQLIISPTSCRELMPDPEFFAQCLRDSFEELRALTQAAAGAARPRGAARAVPRTAPRTTPSQAGSTGNARSRGTAKRRTAAQGQAAEV